MLCPVCKKDTAVIDSKPSKKGLAIKRRRICICGIKFTTFERAMPIKSTGSQKLLKRTAWQYQSFLLYGEQRIYDCRQTLYDCHDFSKKIGDKNINRIYFAKDFNKTFGIVEYYKNKELHEKRFPSVTKMQTIKNLLKDNLYWNLRYKILLKPREDQSNPKKRKKEEKYFEHAINTYIAKPWFNQDFFFQNCRENIKYLWKETDIWKMFEGIR
jgi:hypothetical protein